MKIKKEDIFFFLYCIVTALIFAVYRCTNGDFVAYNGDFQNYNIFRRLAEGQVQYRDFVNYLGNGLILINFPFVYFFRTFGNSVFITNFTTSILYSFILCISFYTIIHDRKKVYIISEITAIAAFLILHTGFSGTFYYKYIYNILFMEELGHSMRTTRAFLPFMFVGIFYVVRNKVKCKDFLMHIFRTNKLIAVVCFVLGMFVVWSNDYGYSCAACFLIIMLLVNIFGLKIPFSKRIVKYITAIMCIVMGAMLSVMIITHGNINEYFSVTFGITQYQFWYYGNDYNKYLTVANIFSDKKYVFLTITFFVHTFIFLMQIISSKINDDSICRLFLHSVCYCASVIYVVGSGAHNYAALELVTYIFIIGFLRILWKRLIFFKNKKYSIYAKWLPTFTNKKIRSNLFSANLIIMMLMYCISINIIRTNISYINKNRITSLDIYSTIGIGLDECAEVIAGETVFSTYAGALETVNSTFQPTGIDYIIHVLGDNQRKKYITNFTEGDYKYVSTLKNEYTIWEYWSSRVNWYFYRELYLNYKPVNETSFSVIWKKSDNKNLLETTANLNWEYINKSTCRIDIELPDYEGGAYVDLEIKYNTAWTKDRLRKGGMRKVLCVQDGGERYNVYGSNSCYYLNESTESSYIPVYVRDGKGYAYISSYPISCTKLEGVGITIKNIIKEPDFPLHLTNYTDLGRTIDTDSINQEGTVLKFDNTEYTTTMLENISQVRANSELGVVNNVWKDGNYIYVSLENPVNPNNFIYPNNIEVVKREKHYTAQNYSDDNWVCGISRYEGKILINEEIDIKNLYAIKVGKIIKKVISTELTKNGYSILLEDNSGAQIFAYPQEIELLYH